MLGRTPRLVLLQSKSQRHFIRNNYSTVKSISSLFKNPPLLKQIQDDLTFQKLFYFASFANTPRFRLEWDDLKKLIEESMKQREEFVKKPLHEQRKLVQQLIIKEFEKLKLENKEPEEPNKDDQNKKEENKSEESKEKEAKEKEAKEKEAKEKEAKEKEAKEKEAKEKETKEKETNENIPDLQSMIFTIILVILIESLFNRPSYEKTTWQEFQNSILPSGKVTKIEVVNKQEVHVHVTQDEPQILSQQQPEFSSSSTMDEESNSFNNDSQQPKRSQKNFRSKEKVYYFTIGDVDTFEQRLEEAQQRLGIAYENYVPVYYKTTTSLFELLPIILSIGFIFLLFTSMKKSTGGINDIFDFGKSKAKRFDKKDSNITFKDVAGIDEAKTEIMEFVEFLKNPKKFTDLGAKVPKGALLCGPPGTGKTLLAKAVAGEANVPFFSISGSDFVEMFVGIGPSRVRELFKEAREHAPCIIFIDEIDAIGRQRNKKFSGGNDERENTLNQLLVEMDGFSSQTNVIILAGTNRADILDSALTRPGRFDRKVFIDKPDMKGRKDIFQVYLKNIKLDENSSDIAGRLAGLTPGFTGADIASLCNESAIVAARKNKTSIDIKDFEVAIDRVIGGLESRKLMTPHEKRIVAFHEAGHAVAGWFLKHSDPLLKVTIVPRSSGALGFAQYLPQEVYLRNEDQIIDMICVALAGRASEQIEFNEVTTGAADDLQRVTQIVYQMIQVFGFSPRVGQLSLPSPENIFEPRRYSEDTAEMIDTEAKMIVDKAYERIFQLLVEKKDKVKALAELLIDKETINHDDIVQVIGPRPFEPNKHYQEFILTTRFDQSNSNQQAKDQSDSNVQQPNDQSNLNQQSNDQSDSNAQQPNDQSDSNAQQPNDQSDSNSQKPNDQSDSNSQKPNDQSDSNSQKPIKN